ncbi:chain-length determining protein [Bacteroidia bacterium]|nr:chain-length determining protein [Bacteroidia bacterium]
MNDLNKDIPSTEQEIDLIELAKTVWEKRKFVVKICIIGAIIGLVLAFSLPKEYKTEVILLPDTGSIGAAGNLSALASMAGINLQQNKQEIPPELYPDIVISTPFLVGLFDIQVKDMEENIDTTLYEYINNHQSKAWWSYILGLPKTIIELFSEEEEEVISSGNKSRIIRLSDDQESVLKNLENRIDTYIDNKTGEISLSVKMQNANISAYIADTITSYLQEYIIRFRTQKAREDLAFTEELYKEAQSQYYKTQQDYATFVDGNISIVSLRYKTMQDRLQNEMMLSYNIYNQMAQQLQLAKVKVQDITPVLKIIQPAVVPLKRSSPKRMLILIGMMFLSFSGACAWVFMKDYKSII